MSERAARWGLLAILAVYLLAGSVYSLVTPLGEAPDEMEHFLYMRHIAQERRLPRTAEERLAVGVKGHEPPLYHGLLGLATAWVDTSPLPELKMLDPERWPRHSLPDEVLIDFGPLHTPDEAWPFRGVVLVWHLARLLSLGLMAATLVIVFRVAREILPQWPGVALLAVTAVALAPQFIYIGGSLQNDALAALLGALVAWLLVRMAKGDAHWRQFLLLGLLLGLARLTKFYSLALLPVTVLVLAYLALRQRDRRYALGLLLAMALSFAIPAPWLFYIQPVNPEYAQGWGRLWALFDIVHVERWFGGGEGQAGTGILAIPRALWSVLCQQPLTWASTLFKSFWGYFGAMTLQAPPALYAVAAALSVLSLLGWLRIAWQRLRRQPTVLDEARGLYIPLLLALAFLAVEAAFYGVMKRLPDTAQARHLYPALAGLALLLALGWWGLWRPLASRWATAGLAVLLVGLSAHCLPVARGLDVRPLPPVRSAPWPDAPTEGEALPLGDGLVFEGARWTAATPGRVEGVLFWRADEPPAAEAVVVLELVDAAGAVQAVWAGHPGGPRYPSQAWDAGDHVRQALSWPLPGTLSSSQLSLRLRLLREGVEAASLTLPFVQLPAGQAPAEPAWTHYGLASDAARLRDTLLLTWPDGEPDALVGPDGALWQPLARTTRGDQAAFVVDARVRPGTYVASEGGVAPVTVEGRERSFAPPPDLEPLGVVFGDAVELVGYSLGDGGDSLRVAPGETVRLRLAWRARGRIDRHYTVFTHLVDEQGRMLGQHDKLPGQGYSTLFWAPGEVVVDEYTLTVDPAAAAGTCRIRVGLYQALTGVRAPVAGGGDHVAVGQVEVVP